MRTLLGCAHHHIIFTVPHDLNFLWLSNYKVLGELLFKSARDALFELAADPQYLGAKLGAIVALHTWGQQLPLHPHVHCLATAGGVDGEGNWVVARRKGLVPAEPLKRLFSGKFRYGLRGLARAGLLRLPEGWGRDQVDSLCRELEHKRWNVYICERYENPKAVLNYLGRYLHGGPIGESRLLAFDGNSVHFRYKDYRSVGPDGPRQEVMKLDVPEFVRRFLQHVPPKGFHMVRGYGLYRRGGNTEALRQRVAEAVPPTPALHAEITSPPPTPADPIADETTCAICGTSVVVVFCAAARAAPLPLVA